MVAGLNHEDPPTRFQGHLRLTHESRNIRRMVDYEEGQGEVDLSRQVVERKARIAANSCVDPFGHSIVDCLKLEGFDLIGISLNADNQSVSSHHPSHPETVVAVSEADIEHCHSRLDKIRQYPLRVVKEIPQGAAEDVIKPVRAE